MSSSIETPHMMALLSDLTSASFGAASVSVVSAVSVEPPQASFSASRPEYRPALENGKLASALAQLQKLRQKAVTGTTAPKIIYPRRRPSDDHE